MALLSGDLVSEAVALSYPYIRDEAYSPRALLSHLTRLEREIVGYYVKQAPERMWVPGEAIIIADGENLNGYNLRAGRAYGDFKYINSDGLEWFIEVTPDGKKPSKSPAVYIRSTILFPVDPFTKNWDSQTDRPFFTGQGDSVTYRYTPEPVMITTLTQTLVSPDECAAFLIAALKFQLLLMSSEGVPAERVQEAQQDMVFQRQEWLAGISKRTNPSGRFGDEDNY